MSAPFAKPLDVVEGEIIDEFVIKRLGFKFYEFQWKSVLGYLILYLLACCAVWSWWNGTLRGDLDLNIVLCILALPLVVLARALRALLQLRRGERLILGTDCFQRVTKSGQVLTQLPYMNIARIEFVSELAQEKYIGIDLLDLNDPATFHAGDESAKNKFGWHYRITDEWSMPVPQIYERLRKRLPPVTDIGT